MVATNQLIDISGADGITADFRAYEWHTFLSPTLETFGKLRIPRPRDFNFLQCLIGITHTEDKKFFKDYVVFGSVSVTDRLIHSAVLSGFTSIFLTTVLHSFSVIGTVIQLFAMRSQACPLCTITITITMHPEIKASPILTLWAKHSPYEL